MDSLLAPLDMIAILLACSVAALDPQISTKYGNVIVSIRIMQLLLQLGSLWHAKTWQRELE